MRKRNMEENIEKKNVFDLQNAPNILIINLHLSFRRKGKNLEKVFLIDRLISLRLDDRMQLL